MKLLVTALFLVAVLSGCSGTKSDAPTSSSTSAPTSSSATASGCAASGLDAVTALSSFEMDMDKAHNDGKLTTDQWTAARDKLSRQTQAASDKDDWVAYCKAIDDMRAELGL